MSNLGKQEENVPVLDIEEQIKIISCTFNLNGEKAYNYVKALPSCRPVEWVEGLFAVPSVTALDPRPGYWESQRQYCAALKIVVDKLIEQQMLYNYLSDFMDPCYMGMTTETFEIVRVLSRDQGDSEILVIDAQIGNRYTHASIQDARAIFQEKEYGIWALAVGAILLTHPKRLSKTVNSEVLCPGDISFSKELGYAHGNPGSLIFSFDEEGLALQTAGQKYANNFAGVGSFYLR